MFKIRRRRPRRHRREPSAQDRADAPPHSPQLEAEPSDLADSEPDSTLSADPSVAPLAATRIAVGGLEVIRRVLSCMRVTLESGTVPLANCVQTCLEMQFALSYLNIESTLETVALAVEASDGTVLGQYGPGSGPWYLGDCFNGHAVLYVPQESALVDPAIEQFKEVRECPSLPRFPIFEIPEALEDLGDEPIEIRLEERIVVYYPNPAYCDAWQHAQFGENHLGPILRSTGHGIALDVWNDLQGRSFVEVVETDS